jgi:hypothetical protein
VGSGADGPDVAGVWSRLLLELEAVRRSHKASVKAAVNNHVRFSLTLRP